jgi:hypothetical protein
MRRRKKRKRKKTKLREALANDAAGVAIPAASIAGDFV